MICQAKLSAFEAEGLLNVSIQPRKRARKHEETYRYQRGMMIESCRCCSFTTMDVVDISIIGIKKQIENKMAELGLTFDFSKVKIINLEILKIMMIM
jgi:phosphate acetyltransferase